MMIAQAECSAREEIMEGHHGAKHETRPELRVQTGLSEEYERRLQLTCGQKHEWHPRLNGKWSPIDIDVSRSAHQGGLSD